MALKCATCGSVLRALEYAIENGAKVSSNSYTGCDEKLYKNVLANAPQHLFVTSAGN